MHCLLYLLLSTSVSACMHAFWCTAAAQLSHSLCECPCRTPVSWWKVGRSRVREGSMHCLLYLLLSTSINARMHAMSISTAICNDALVAACCQPSQVHCWVGDLAA